MVDRDPQRSMNEKSGQQLERSQMGEKQRLPKGGIAGADNGGLGGG